LKYSDPMYGHVLPMAAVVHLKRKNGVEVVACDVYIGRAMYQGGWRLAASKWANPFSISGQPGGDRESVIEKYRAHVLASPELMEALPGLKGMVLGCWCVGPRCLTCGAARPRGVTQCGHLQCHGEVLAELLEAFEAKTEPSSAGIEPPHIPDDDPMWGDLFGS
jgi:hypothetical protein